MGLCCFLWNNLFVRGWIVVSLFLLFVPSDNLNRHISSCNLVTRQSRLSTCSHLSHSCFDCCPTMPVRNSYTLSSQRSELLHYCLWILMVEILVCTGGWVAELYFFLFKLLSQFLPQQIHRHIGNKRVFILPKQGGHFIHCWSFIIFPVHSWQGAGIQWWYIPYNSSPHQSHTFNVIWILGVGIINQVNSIHHLYQSYFPQVLNTFLHGDLFAWAKYQVFLEETSFPHDWQEWLPFSERLCLLSNCFVSASFPRKGSQLFSFTAS